MGIVIRQTIKTTAVIGMGALLGGVITIVQSKVFAINEMGAARNLINQGSVLYLFLLMGTVSVVHTYSQRYDLDDPKRPVIITWSILAQAAATLLFCIPYFLLKEVIINRYQIPSDREYVRTFYNWLPVLGFLWSLMTLLEYFLQSRMKVALATSMREVVLRLLNIVLIALFYAGLIGLEQFVIGTVLVHVIPVTLLLAVAQRTKGFGIDFNYRIFSRQELRDIVHYAWYHMLLTVSSALTVTLDLTLLGMLSPRGLTDVAIYTWSVFLISILGIPYRAMSSAAFPKLNQSFVDNDPEMPKLFIRSAVNMQVVAVGMWLLIACNLHNVQAILAREYAELAPCFLILSAGQIIHMFTGLNTELISISNHYKFTFRLSALLLVAILILDYIFIPMYGLYAAAWVTSGTLAAFNIAKMIFLKRKMGLLPLDRRAGMLTLAGAGVYGLMYFVPVIGSAIPDAIFRSVLIGIVFGAFLLWYRPSPDLSDLLRKILPRKRF